MEESNGFDEVLEDGIQIVKDSVAEVFFSQLVPQVFCGVEFGTVGREVYDGDVVGNLEFCCAMPSGSVHDHEDVFVRMFLGHLVEERTHGMGIDVGVDERGHGAGEGIDRSIEVEVLADVMGMHCRAHAWRHPTGSWIADAPETCFVLEEHAQRSSLRMSAGRSLVQERRPVFLKSACFAASACG